MLIIWIIGGACAGLFSLYLHGINSTFSYFFSSLVAWGYCAVFLYLIERKHINAPMQFISANTLIGALLLPWGMAPLSLVQLFPGGSAYALTPAFAYLSRAFGGAVISIVLFYMSKVTFIKKEPSSASK